MEDWEDAEIVLPKKETEKINKWDGEDEDDEVKDSWEDEEEKKDEEKLEVQPQPAKLKPKKAAMSKLNDIERQKDEEEDLLERERLENMTPEDRAAEKLRLQKIQIEADLNNALDTFGVSKNDLPTGLEAFFPTTKLEFTEFAEALSSKINLFKSSEHFPSFVEDLIRSICANLSAADMRKVKANIETLHTEKQKLEKEKTKKAAAKGKSKIKLRMDDSIKSNNIGDYETYDYDDFM